jgi:hypothetical protein
MKMKNGKQKILVFEQNKSGEKKVAGIKRFAKDRFDLEMVSIDGPLPPVIDDASGYLPAEIEADVVLDFFKHPDLSHDLALLCRERGIPVVASGKKIQMENVFVPPT